MKAITITAIIVLGIIGLAIIGERKGAPRQIVFEACQASRTGNKITENTCGELQDYYHMEYLCKANNFSASNKCWVENVDPNLSLKQ